MVGLQVWMQVLQERVRGLASKVRIDLSDGHVQAGEAPGCGIRLLTEEVCLAGGVKEPVCLDEQAPAAAAGVVDLALMGLQHVHHELDEAGRGVVLAGVVSSGMPT